MLAAPVCMSCNMLKRGLACGGRATAGGVQVLPVLCSGPDFNHYVQYHHQTTAPGTCCYNCRQTAAASAPGVQQQQQQRQQQELPSLLELLSTHGASLTTAAQMVWAQVIEPGDTVVDATCGNGNDTLFMAQRVGPTGTVYGMDLQESAIQLTRHALHTHLAAPAMPQVHLQRGCHSQLQQLIGSSVAKLVAFNLGYLPGGDKKIVTQTSSTLQAIIAALEVVCPGGLVSIICYIGHPGGLEEYEQVRELLAGLSPNRWTSSEFRLVNRPTAPILLMLWRRHDDQSDKDSSRQ